MRVLICGGGIIGTSIAYFLSCRGVKATVIERTGIACAASGKSGGFLALDWCDRTPLEALARRSFALHASLPERIGGDWGYRRLTTYGGTVGTRGRRNARDLGWLGDEVAIGQRLGSTDTTAQVHPGQLTAAMMRVAQAQGAELRAGQVTGIVRSKDATRIEGVEIDGEHIEGDAVVIAMGPWSVLAARWLPLPPVFGLKGHSLVFETGDGVPAHALFLEMQEAGHGWHSPEVIPRPDGTTWVCAISSESAVPLDPADVDSRPRRDRAPRRHVRAHRARIRLVQGPGEPGLPPARHPGWPAADWRDPRPRGRLRGHRAQCLGHPQRARHRRSDG